MLHVYSEDYVSGSRYNGVWHLNQKVKGTFQIISQTIQTQNIPWATLDSRLISFSYVDEAEETINVSVDLFDEDFSTIRYTNDLETIRAHFEAELNESGVFFGNAYSVIITLENNNSIMRFVFDIPLTINWTDSGVAKIFNKTGTETSDTFIIYTCNMTTTPRLLYIKINEASSAGITSSPEENTVKPTLIVSTQDTELVNQYLIFTSATKILTLKIYLPNITSTPVELSNSWDMMLIPV